MIVIKNLLFASVVVDGNGAKVAIFNSSATERREVDRSVRPSGVWFDQNVIHSVVDYHALVVLSKHLSYHEFGYIEDDRVGEMWHEFYMGFWLSENLGGWTCSTRSALCTAQEPFVQVNPFVR